MYAIEFDARSGTLLLKLEGFWTPDELRRFAQNVTARAAEARRQGFGRFHLLSDSRGFPVQSPEVADGFARLMRGAQAANTGKAAIVVGSRLNKLQAERAMAGPRLRVFMSMEEAREWLDQADG